MAPVRCCMCRHRYVNLRKLKLHYLMKHSKSSIVKQLLKSRVLLATPNVAYRKPRRAAITQLNDASKSQKRPSRQIGTLYLSDEINVYVRTSEISIGDGKRNFRYRFPKPEDARRQKVTKKEKYPNKRVTRSQQRELNSTTTSKLRTRKSPAASTWDGFHLKITRMQDMHSLNDQTGEFYVCHCKKKPARSRKTRLTVVMSDTESCSDGDRLYQPPKFFCRKCGNGYRTGADLVKHLRSHGQFCMLCNTSFSSEYCLLEHARLHRLKVFICHLCRAEFPVKDMLVKHFEWHVEDRILDDVVDMESVYYMLWNDVKNYRESLGNIMFYLMREHY